MEVFVLLDLFGPVSFSEMITAARSPGIDLNDQQPVMVFKSLNDRHDKQFLSQSAHFQKVSILSVVQVLIWVKHVKNYCKANGGVELIKNVRAICLCATFTAQVTRL